MSPKKAVEPLIFQVKTTFNGRIKGQDVTYVQGEAVHPDDPCLAKWPEFFEPLQFPHDHLALIDAKDVPEPEPDYGNVDWTQDAGGWPPTLEQVIAAGYTEDAAAAIVEEEAAKAAALAEATDAGAPTETPATPEEVQDQDTTGGGG